MSTVQLWLQTTVHSPDNTPLAFKLEIPWIVWPGLLSAIKTQDNTPLSGVILHGLFCLGWFWQPP